MYDRILVPTDGSEPAAVAGDMAIALAEAFEADVHAVFVQETGGWPFGLSEEETAELRRLGEEAVAAVADRAAEAGIEGRV